jgi:hypothetical protein
VVAGGSGFFPNSPPPRKLEVEPVAFSAGLAVVAPNNPPKVLAAAFDRILESGCTAYRMTNLVWKSVCFLRVWQSLLFQIGLQIE